MEESSEYFAGENENHTVSVKIQTNFTFNFKIMKQVRKKCVPYEKFAHVFSSDSSNRYNSLCIYHLLGTVSTDGISFNSYNSVKCRCFHHFINAETEA